MRGALGGLILAVAAHAGDDLVDRLGSPDWAVFSAAAGELRTLQEAEALRLLPRALEVERPLARTEFARVLGGFGAGAAPAVPDLAAACFDEDETVRTQAGAALGSIGPAAWKALSMLDDLDPGRAGALLHGAGMPDRPPTDVWADEPWRKRGRSLGEATEIGALEEAFRHPHAYVRHRAAAELVRRGAAGLPALDRLAGDPSVRVRRRAANALAALARTEGAVPLLAARLRDPDEEMRTAALMGLGDAGAVGPLNEYAAEAGSETFATTVRALEQASPGASHPLLRRALRSDDPVWRGIAVSQVAYLGSSARPLLPDMIDALFDEAWAVREVARRSLLVIGGTPDEVTPWLREIPGVTLDGVFAASKAEMPRRIADGATLEELKAALAGQDPLAAGQAAAALGAREPKGAETASLLVAALRHERNYVRMKAAVALAAYGDPGVSALASALEDEDPRVRWRAIAALGSMGAAARDAVPAIVAQLDGATLGPASEALVQMGPAASEALPALVAILEGDDDAKANAAMSVIAAIGEEAKLALPLLIEALDDKGRSHAATRAVGAFGRAAEPAVPKLRRLLLEAPPEWPDVQVFMALLRIGGEGHSAAAVMFRPATARQARNLIRDLKVGSSELVLALLELLKSSDTEVVARAREALAWVQPTPDLRAPELILAMEADSFGNEERANALAEKATVAELVEALGRTEGWGRWGAVVALGLKGPAAREAAPAVAQVLVGNARTETRVAAARTLLLVRGPAAQTDLFATLRTKPAADVTVAIEKILAEIGDVARLSEALTDGSPEVRASAMRALGRIDPLPPETIRALVANFASPEHYVKGVEHILASKKAEALPLVAPLLRADDERVKKRTIDLLVDMGPEAIPYLANELKEHDPLVRVAAVLAAGKLGEAGRPELMRVLREDPHPDVRRAALGVLCRKQIDLEAANIALDDKEACDRAVDLVCGGRNRTLAVEFLVGALARATSRQAALRAVGPSVYGKRVTADEARSALRFAMVGRTGEAQAGAALALARIEEIHVEGLRAALRSEDEETRFEACRVLAAAGSEAAAPAALELLAVLEAEGRRPRQGPRVEVRLLPRYALAALGAIGPRARELLPALRKALGSAGPLGPYYAVAIARIEGGLLAVLGAGAANRSAAWEALAFSGPAGIRELGQIVALGEGEVLEEAATRLAHTDEMVVPVVSEILRHERKEARIKAAWILGTMRSRGRDAVPALVLALADRETEVRVQVAWALGAIGAASALPALEELRKEEALRKVADEAIARIRG